MLGQTLTRVVTAINAKADEYVNDLEQAHQNPRSGSISSTRTRPSRSATTSASPSLLSATPPIFSLRTAARLLPDCRAPAGVRGRTGCLLCLCCE